MNAGDFTLILINAISDARAESLKRFGAQVPISGTINGFGVTAVMLATMPNQAFSPVKEPADLSICGIRLAVRNDDEREPRFTIRWDDPVPSAA